MICVNSIDTFDNSMDTKLVGRGTFFNFNTPSFFYTMLYKDFSGDDSLGTVTR